MRKPEIKINPILKFTLEKSIEGNKNFEKFRMYFLIGILLVFTTNLILISYTSILSLYHNIGFTLSLYGLIGLLLPFTWLLHPFLFIPLLISISTNIGSPGIIDFLLGVIISSTYLTANLLKLGIDNIKNPLYRIHQELLYVYYSIILIEFILYIIGLYLKTNIIYGYIVCLPIPALIFISSISGTYDEGFLKRLYYGLMK